MSDDLQATIERLQKQPGVIVSRLPIGAVVRIETIQSVFEMTYRGRENRIIDLMASDPRLHEMRKARFLGSSLDLDGRIFVDDWIGRSLRLRFEFKDTVYVSMPALSCRVEWAVRKSCNHYDVF